MRTLARVGMLCQINSYWNYLVLLSIELILGQFELYLVDYLVEKMTLLQIVEAYSSWHLSNGAVHSCNTMGLFV